jgi:hypothetical protein
MREMHIVEIYSYICVAFIVGKPGIAREEANSLYKDPIGLFVIF